MFSMNIIGPTLIVRQLKSVLNSGSCVLFFSSVATKKGSYDIAYGSSKAAISGLINSLSKHIEHVRFNAVSLGLVQNTSVEKGMTTDFKSNHVVNMFNNQLISLSDVYSSVLLLVENQGICKTELDIDGGFH